MMTKVSTSVIGFLVIGLLGRGAGVPSARADEAPGGNSANRVRERAADNLKSGPPVGAENDRSGFRPQFVTGPSAGRSLCPV